MDNAGSSIIGRCLDVDMEKREGFVDVPDDDSDIGRLV